MENIYSFYTVLVTCQKYVTNLHKLRYRSNLYWDFFLQRGGLVPNICMLEKIEGNPISTLPPCSSFHIGEVIQTWLAGLMR